MRPGLLAHHQEPLQRHSKQPPPATTTAPQADRQLEQGLLKRLPNLALTILGQPYTTASIQALLDKRIAAVDAVVQAHGAWQAAVQALRDLLAQTGPVILAVKRYIRIEFENDAAALADFGMKPSTKKVQTAAEKALATARRLATRKQRGIGSKKAATVVAAAGTPAANATATATASDTAGAPAAPTPPAKS